MKRTLLNPMLKRLVVAVPAAALMLGSSQAGVTVGLNFQSWYYDSLANPQTVGFGFGYQTTGFPVTAKAFGVDVVNWFHTDPLPSQAPILSTSTLFGSTSSLAGGSNTFAGTLTLTATAPNSWQSGIGEQNSGWVAETVTPGDFEVTWGYLDDGNVTSNFPTATVSGLTTKFPNGYVVQTIAANSGNPTFNNADVSDGVTTNSLAYTTHHVVNPANDGLDTAGTYGLSASSGLFTSDTIHIAGEPKTVGSRSVICGFIITDQPVVSTKPVGGNKNQGTAFTLTAGAVGIPPLSYQWLKDGSPITGATTTSYTVASATTNDAGNYQLVATNLYGSGTSVAANISIQQVPIITSDLPGTTNLIFAGEVPALSVTAIGPQLHYIWLKNGTTAVGSDSSTFTYALTAADSGSSFSVIVSNSFGTATSTNKETFVVTASPNLYTSTVGTDGPGAWWPLNESSGASVALDYSGRGNNGFLSNSITPGVVGPRPPTDQGFDSGKTAYLFDGATALIGCGTGPSLAGTTDFSVEAWVNTTNNGNGVVVQQRSPIGYNGEYQVQVNGNGTVYFSVYGGGYQFNFSSLAASKYVNDGNWHHIAAVRNGTNGIIYIDGSKVASASGTFIAPLDSTIATFIGADARDGVSHFGGSICDVAIYTYALPASRIAAHARTGVLANSPLVITTSSGGFIADTKPSGTPYPGLNFGTTWLASYTDTASVTRSGVAQFPLGRQIAVPDNAVLDSSTGTICFWMNYAVPLNGFPGPGHEAAMLFDHRTTNGCVIALNVSGGIEFQSTAGINNFTNGYVVDGNWHHVAVTYDQSASGVVTLYIDGNLGISQANTNAWGWVAGQELELGRSHDPYWYDYNGLMDDVRIYNRILTQAEVQSIVTGTLVDTTPAALTLRYNFDTSGVGKSINWPVGGLQSTPALSPSTWTPVGNASLTLPFLPPGNVPVTTNSTLFYRVGF